jgi:hypothetical protein
MLFAASLPVEADRAERQPYLRGYHRAITRLVLPTATSLAMRCSAVVSGALWTGSWAGVRHPYRRPARRTRPSGSRARRMPGSGRPASRSEASRWQHRTAARRAFSLTLPVAQGDAVDRRCPRLALRVGPVTGLLTVTVDGRGELLAFQHPGPPPSGLITSNLACHMRHERESFSTHDGDT